MNKKHIKLILDILFLMLYGLLLYTFTYIIKYEDITSSIYTLKHLINVGAIRYIIVPYLIILSIQFIIKGIIKDNWKTNIITTIIVLTITIISYYKNKILKLPFLPNDILLIGNVNQIAKFGLTFPAIHIILIIIILVLILLLEYLITKKYNLLKTENTLGISIKRTIIFTIGISLLYNLCIMPTRYTKFNIKNDLGDNYSWMGGNAVFFMHLGDFYSIKPDGYNNENIENIKKETIIDYSVNNNNSNKPNIIMIMNESFSDVNNIKNVDYSVNPIHNIESLAKYDKNCRMR